jgi:predicted MFS family arabinose efflux permease
MMRTLAHVTLEETGVLVAALAIGFMVGVAFIAGRFTGRRQRR